MAQRLTIFVSHSFDDSDSPLVNTILSVMRQSKFHFDIRTAKPPKPGRIEDHVLSLIDAADVTFGIFTKRYSDKLGSWVPPPYVISECSVAKGRYHGDERKGVHGIVEAGVQHKDIGLPTLSGQNFPVFSREQILDRNGDAIKSIRDYLTTLQRNHGAAFTSHRRPYRQKDVKKTVEILRNGTGIFKNTICIEIFNAERAQSVQHELWLPQGGALELPKLDQMVRTRSTDRLASAFFAAFCFRRNNSTIRVPEPMKVSLVNRSRRAAKINLTFPFDLRDHDILEYQYVWSVPRAFAVFEDDLGPNEYNEVSFRTPHGTIGCAHLKLKFEREVVHGACAQLFSKEPFIQHSYSPTEDGILFLEADAMEVVEPDAGWEIYRHDLESMDGALRARWRPSSRATVEATVAPSNGSVGSESMGDLERPLGVARSGRRKMVRVAAFEPVPTRSRQKKDRRR